MIEQHAMEIRVRYHETDGQGRVHHAQYLNFFERGRVEMMRDSGLSYRELEEGGLMLVVSKMEIEYFLPAQFDDLLVLTTEVTRAKGARIHHHYRITREESLLVRGSSEIACIDRSGQVRRLPDFLTLPKKRTQPE